MAFLFFAAPEARSQVNGQNVSLVRFGSDGKEAGMFAQKDEKRWFELGADNTKRFEFEETGRDEWSVYLTDASRDMKVQLDLYTKEVKFTQGTSSGVLAQVTKAIAAPVRKSTGRRPEKGDGPNKSESAKAAAQPAEAKKIITIEVPDMDEADKLAVMKWIKVEATGDKLPFCWRQSYGRGVGEPLSTCANGMEKDGLLCYPRCNEGYGAAGPVCWAKCPPGFTDIGAFCQKPGPYGRGAGYPWKFGDGFNLDGAWERCRRDNPQGCEKYGEIIYPKCKPGYHAVGCCVCSPDCPPGWTDTGTGCTKPSYGRGAGEPMVCRAGLEKDAALCYPPCKPGFHGVGPVCWQDIPPGWINCGAACAKSEAECAMTVSDQVLSTVTVAANIATLGLATPATGGAAVGQQSVKIAGKAMTGGSRLGNAFVKAVGVMQTIKPGKLAKDATLVRKIAHRAGQVKDTIEVASTLYEAGSNFASLFADDFAKQTSAEIDREINRRFRPEVARYLKEQWGLIQLDEMAQANGFVVAQDVMAIVSLVDISGVTGMVGSFVKPLCEDPNPFPALRRNYN